LQIPSFHKGLLRRCTLKSNNTIEREIDRKREKEREI